MAFAEYIVDIKRLVYAITGKYAEVHISYRGTELGQTRPWIIKCDSREVEHESHEEAAKMLFNLFSEDLRKKIDSVETQANNYRSFYNDIIGPMPSKPGSGLKKSIDKDLS